MKLPKNDWKFFKANHANLLVYFDRGDKATKVLTNAINGETGIKYHYTKLRSGRLSRQEIDVPKIILDYNLGTHGVDQRN